MQFLPSTWAAVAVDGDADGRRDVQDIDDASLGSAVYLCADHGDLATRGGPARRAAPLQPQPGLRRPGDGDRPRLPHQRPALPSSDINVRPVVRHDPAGTRRRRPPPPAPSPCGTTPAAHRPRPPSPSAPRPGDRRPDPRRPRRSRRPTPTHDPAADTPPTPAPDAAQPPVDPTAHPTAHRPTRPGDPTEPPVHPRPAADRARRPDPRPGAGLRRRLGDLRRRPRGRLVGRSRQPCRPDPVPGRPGRRAARRPRPGRVRRAGWRVTQDHVDDSYASSPTRHRSLVRTGEVMGRVTRHASPRVRRTPTRPWTALTVAPHRRSPPPALGRDVAVLTAWLLLGASLLLVVAAGVFVAAEFSFVTVDRSKVARAAERGRRARPPACSRRCARCPPSCPAPRSASRSPTWRSASWPSRRSRG